MSVHFWSGVVIEGQLYKVPARLGYVLHVQQAIYILDDHSLQMTGECYLYTQTKGIDGEEINAILSRFQIGREPSHHLSKNQTPQYVNILCSSIGIDCSKSCIIDTVFGCNHPITFEATFEAGATAGSIHLSGYFQKMKEFN